MEDELPEEEIEIENLTTNLVHRLEIDFITGLDKCENAIKGKKNKDVDFYSYLDHLQNRFPRSTCQTSWNVKTLAVICKTCQKDSSSCICLKCFLNGNHEGHDVFLCYSTSGNCDCGDPILWNPSGNCNRHTGTDAAPELTQIERKNRVSIIAVSRALFCHLLFYANFERMSFNLIIKWIQRIVYLGDAPRRCVVIAWMKIINFYEFFQRCLSLNKSDTDLLLSFLGSLANDFVFRDYLCKAVIENFDHILWISGRLTLLAPPDGAVDEAPLYPALNIFSFMTQGICPTNIKNIVLGHSLNWIKIMINSLKIIFNFSFSSIGNYFRQHGFLSIAHERLFSVVEIGIKEKEKTEAFIKPFCKFLKKCELVYPRSRVFGAKFDDSQKLQFIVFDFFFGIFKILSYISTENIISETPLTVLNEFFESDSFKKIDIDVPGSIFEHPITQKNVTFSQALTLHMLSYICLNKNSVNLLTHNNEKCNQKSSDDIPLSKKISLKKWLLMPLRWYAACDLCVFDFFVRNETEIITALSSFKFRTNIKHKFTPTFSLIQTILFSSFPKHEKILKIIAHTYGMFQDDEDLQEKQIRGRFFCFVFLICCLVFDNLCANYDFFTMRRLAVMTQMRLSPLTGDQIDKLWYEKPMNESQFVEDLLSFSTRISTSSGTQYKIANDSEWHPILPFIEVGLILRSIQDFVSKNPGSLIKFPSLSNEKKFILSSPLIFAFEFYALMNFSSDMELLQLVLNLLVITSSSADKLEDTESNEKNQDSTIVADNVLELIHELSGFTLYKFLRTKIAFHGKEETTVVKLIKDLGELGHLVLDRLNIHDKDTISKEKKSRERSKRLREQILHDFNSQQSTFSDLNNLSPESALSNDACCVCHCETDDYLIYPCLSYKSVLPYTIQNRVIQKTHSLKICLHPIHSNCLENSRKYICPNDRCPRNCALPILTNEYKPIKSARLLKGVIDFVNMAYGIDTFVVDIVRSYSVEIEMLEIRYRSNPVCLDSHVTQEMLHYVYLALWHTRTNEADYILDHDDDSITPLMKYMLFLISLGDKTSQLPPIELLVVISKNVKKEEMLTFLRCCAIFDHFGRGEKIEKGFIDWDKVLSAEFLQKHYKINISEQCVEKPMYDFTSLPKNFIDFINPPFNVDITNDLKGEIALCLFTRRLVTLPNSVKTKEKSHLPIDEYLKLYMKKTFSAFLVLNGPQASSVIICDLTLNAMIHVKGFYVDKFGDEDIGLVRGRLLTLSDSKKEEAIEEILSGNWTNKRMWDF